ncbi:hypothetical protein [Roseisolibacter sp. H3M3-2]|uniref:hypothetical protein n=1 Tax=Roseisolibacter sp. H3M3-2 TaxID=3031323 RepID=UPI0023DA31EB|nr:hypothetical protein [Roseisolibacter sp. H3M3-2]MDF1506085.1 hypothetical protein [Roseisolibacter sp. H3M3-2]
MSTRRPHDAPRPAVRVHPELLAAVVAGRSLGAVVPRLLDLAERDPLASAGRFPSDVVRGLMEVPGSFWGRHPDLYARYQAALRASAAARRRLPADARLAFWGPLDDDFAVRRAEPDAGVTRLRRPELGDELETGRRPGA